MTNTLTPTQVHELKQALRDKTNAPHHRKIQALILYSENQNLTASAKSVGFVHIAGGCNSDWMNEFLHQLSEAYPDDYIILVMDNAVWHKSQTLNIPENIEFTFIPPYTPEMNPIEQVWAEIRKRGFKNKIFRSLNEIIDKLQEVIQNLSPSQLKSIVRRDWSLAIFDFS